MKNLILHLGVHKTATTHFQSRLYNSQHILSNLNIGYLGLDETRKCITSKILREFIIEDKLEEIIADNKILLLSDENIIGGTEKIKSNLIYPNVNDRLSFLLEKLPVELDNLHITIRDPEAYLISRYCEYLRHNRFISITEYVDSFELLNFSWLPLIKSIEDTCKIKVQVTTFESIFNNEQAYLEKITGVKVEFAKASEGASIRRSKITLETYRILEHLADHYPRHMTIKLMNMMDNNNQRSKGTPLKPFSDELSSSLKENYANDKKELGLL